MQRYKLIACRIMQREIGYVMVSCKNALDISYIRQDLHQTPQLLTKVLQDEIDRIESGEDLHTNEYTNKKLDAILLGYGLCSNALVGLKSSKIPLVIPRAHDCNTLFMGSKEKYAEYFEKVKGNYFATQGWMEIGADLMESNLKIKEQEYMEQYEDEDTVEYLMEIERAMLQNYHYMTYISWPGIYNTYGEKMAKAIAKEKGWEYLTYEGSDSLLSDFLNGNWNDENFLVLQPGEEVQPSYDEKIIKKLKKKS